jgi:hypothetical protein
MAEYNTTINNNKRLKKQILSSSTKVKPQSIPSDESVKKS